VSRLEELSGHGYKRTTQRAVILDILETAGGHLTAEEVARLVEEGGVPLNRSTVYRTLDTLAEIGVVKATRMGRALYYEVNTEGDEEHHHIRCNSCHQMVHLDAGRVDRLLGRLADEQGFAVADIQVLVRGVCRDCQQRPSPAPA
jgi:Fur family ferric uptake transcriptional regulator